MPSHRCHNNNAVTRDVMTLHVSLALDSTDARNILHVRNFY